MSRFLVLLQVTRCDYPGCREGSEVELNEREEYPYPLEGWIERNGKHYCELCREKVFVLGDLEKV